MRVKFNKESTTYLNELVFVLVTKGYFSYPSSAIDYIEKLYAFGYNYIPLLPGKKAPEKFKRYGWPLFYIAYKPNKQTTWYIFYIRRGERFLVTFITNNHVTAHLLNELSNK